MLRILLTGGSGFIGKNILEQLGDRYSFLAPTHHQVDLLSFNSVKKYFETKGPFDVVLHCAVVGGNRKTGDGKNFALDSLRMFENLSFFMYQFSWFFNFGSGIEYGKERPIKSFAENEFGQLVPQNNWGLFKYSCAKLVEANPNKFINLRLFGVFGKYEDYSIRFISNSICKNIMGMPIIINKNVVYSYLYMDDLIKVVDFFLNNKPRFNVYNVTPSEKTDLLEIAKNINLISQKPVPIKIRHRVLDNEYTGNNARLLKEMKNLSFTKIDDAISELYKWYMGRKNIIDKKKLIDDYF